MRGDLLPILSTWKESKKSEKSKKRVALSCLELLVPLTWPLEQEEMTMNHHRHTPYILQAQVKYKASVLHWEATAVIRQAIRIALPALTMRRDERTARDEGIIKLVLYFIRNIAAIRQTPNLPSQGLDTEVSRSATIEVFRAQDVFALLLTMCSNMGEDFSLQDVIILEIIFNLVKGVDVEKLWMTESQRTKTGISDLKDTLAAEKAMHMEAKKNEWSRHGRFGTMIWVKQDDKNMKAVSGQDNLRNHKTAMFNVDNNKKWNRPLQKRKDLDHNAHDFDRKETLSASASEQLRNFVEEFLDSSFNPLISNLRKAIEREAERLLPINYRQFFYVVSWFLRAERVRRQRKQAGLGSSKAVVEFDPESYTLVAAVLNQETFITLNRYMQVSYDEKAWQDLNASMRCFTEILLTVQDMAQSPLEEDQEIAENIQNRIFYEETTHDRVRLLLSGYKDQGLGYLDACTDLAHVFLRMLERYSKENIDLQIRSKRKANRKKREAQHKRSGENVENEDEESENEDITDVVQVSKERKFDLKRFTAKFVTQSSVDTFVSLLAYYRDLSTDQLKRIQRFLHRVAFKQEMAILLYRVDIIALLYKLIEGPDGLDKSNKMHGEWVEFTKQLFKKMFKKLDTRPEMMIEMLFSKIPGTLHYLEHGYEKQSLTSARAPAELEVKSSEVRDRTAQIGVVVTVLSRDHKENLVEWVKSITQRAYDERVGWEAEAEARKALAEQAAKMDDSSTSQPLLDMPAATPSYISVLPSTDEIKIAMFKNARLKLLMKLCGFKMEINDMADTPDATWIVPSDISASHLAESRQALSQYMETHWQPEHEGDNPEDFLRRVRKGSDQRNVQDYEASGEARRDDFIDDSEGDDGPLPEEEEFLFPDNPRRKRNKILEQVKEKQMRKRKRASDDEGDGEDSEDEAAREERKRKRQEAALARRRKFKSEAYIRDSDDESDEEKDRLFFAAEEKLRKRQEQRVKIQMSMGGTGDTPVDEESLRRRREMIDRLRGDTDDIDNEQELDMEEDSNMLSSQPRQNDKDTDTGSEIESTPPSSPPPEEDENLKRRALRDLAQSTTIATKKRPSAMALRLGSGGQDEDSGSELEIEEDDIVPAKAFPRSKSRGGFVIDEDDDDE